MQQNEGQQLVYQFIHSYSNDFISSMQKFEGWRSFATRINVKILVNTGILSFQNIIKILIKLSKTQIATPGELYFKPLTLLILFQLIRNIKKNYFTQTLTQEQIRQLLLIVQQQYISNDFQVDSIMVSKLYIQILKLVVGHSEFYYEKYNQLVFQKQNANSYLIKIIAIFQSSKYYFINDFKQIGVQFLQKSYGRVCEILNNTMGQQLIPTYLCCKVLQHAWGFPTATQIFGKYEKHENWLTTIIQILKSKWYVQDVKQKYKNKQSVQSIYLHTKKYAYVILSGFLKRCIFYKKYKANNYQLAQHLENYSKYINQIINQVGQQITYQCYPQKLRIQQIKLISLIYRSKPEYFTDESEINKILHILIRYVALTPQDEEQIIQNPYASWMKDNDMIVYNKNLRMASTAAWIQMSFPKRNSTKAKKNKSKSGGNNSQKWHSQLNLFNLLNTLLESKNLIQCEASLHILGNIQFQYGPFFKSKQAQTIILQKTLPHLINLCGSNAIMIRNSAFRALAAITKGKLIQKINEETFVNLAQLSYQHLTKDQSVLVRVNAGLTFMKLSLAERNVQHFKLVMYECIVVLLKVMQQVVIEEIANLIISVLRNETYLQTALPLSKQLFIFGCNSFMQIYKGIQKNQQTQQQQQQSATQKYMVIESCCEILCLLLPNINSNDLQPNNIIQKRLYQILQQAKTTTQYQIKQCTIRVSAKALQHLPQLNQKLYELIIQLYQIIIVQQKNGEILTNQMFLVFYTHLCKIIVKSNMKNQIIVKTLSLISQTLQQLNSSTGNGNYGNEYEQRYIIFSFTIINLTSNPVVANKYPNQCVQLKNIVINRVINQIILKNGVLQIKNNKWCLSITFLLSCVILSHFQDIFEGLFNKLNIKNNKQCLFLTFINNAYEKMMKQIKKKQIILQTKILLYKFCIQALLKILDTYTNSPNITFTNNNNPQHNTHLLQNITKIDKKHINNIFKILIEYTKNQLIAKAKVSKGEITEGQELQMYQNQNQYMDDNSESYSAQDANQDGNYNYNDNGNGNDYYNANNDHANNDYANNYSNQMENQECQEDVTLQSLLVQEYYNYLDYIDCLSDFATLLPKIFDKNPQLLQIIEPEYINGLQEIYNKIQTLKSQTVSLQDNLMTLMKSKSK